MLVRSRKEEEKQVTIEGQARCVLGEACLARAATRGRRWLQAHDTPTQGQKGPGGGVPVGAEDAERAAELGFESQRTGW